MAAARARVTRDLREMGLTVREREFAFSALAGRFATPLVGGAAAVLVGLAGNAAVDGHRWLPIVILGLGGLALFLTARWLARHGVLDAPLLRQRGVNLEAVRAGDRGPVVWLCAHLDSKSQPIPTLLRVAGIVLEGVGVLYALILCGAAALGAEVNLFFWMQAAVTTLVGAIPVAFSVVSARSPGALDNASGVATVIEAARLLRDEPRVGVLITDAEELGLAGARAWARGGGRGTVLNCDGIDDHGQIAVMYTGRKPAAVLQAVARASQRTGTAHEARHLVPGILTDSVAFADAGIHSVTFSRGTVRSLLRVHRRTDNLDRLRGTGVAETAGLLAATARDLLNGSTGSNGAPN